MPNTWVMVYFGYPIAHEDDPQRAVRAGLGIIEEMGELNARLQQNEDVTLAVRLGIHTGLVVTGELGAGETREPLGIVGDTPNIAARLQEIAGQNTVVIGPATFRLVHGFFTCETMGVHTLKGISQPMEVYRVRSESSIQSPLDVATTTGMTPLVGREQEVGLLLERWEHVKEGLGQVVLLSGEAGIGKSRLVQVVKERLASEPYAFQEWRCSPYYQNSPLHPVIEPMERWLRFCRENSLEEKLGKLEAGLAQYSFRLPEVVPLVADLLSVPLDDRYKPLNLSPQRQREKTLEVLLAMLHEMAAQQPVLFIVEDLHWGDPTTLELLNMIVDHGPTARIFTLLVFRPEFRPPWSGRAHLTQVTLNRLTRGQVTDMVGGISGVKTLPAEVVEQVVSKTDGVPLFVEELTRMVLESGLLREADEHYELKGPLPPLAIPSTLQDSLTARLDRLATVREVAQLGAVLGREFSYELIQAVSPLDDGKLQQAMARLVDTELLYQRGLPPQAKYFFKHTLIQETAYQSLLRSSRQRYHQQISQVLEERFFETVETQPELIAHHYTEAGLGERAIPYWQRAGQRAMERSAHVEAIGHLTRGLELVKTLPETPESARHELILQTTLGQALVAARGYASPEVEQAFARAGELCQHVGETSELFPVLYGLWTFYVVRSDLRTGRELAEQLLSVAQSIQDPALLGVAHLSLTSVLIFLGEFDAAQTHLEQGIGHYDAVHDRSHWWVDYGQEPRALCLTYASWIQWFLGYPDLALERSHEALTIAQEIAHPYSLALTLSFAAMFHEFRREGQAAQERAEAAIALCTEQKFPFWLAMGTILQGWALVEQGQGEGVIVRMRRGLADWQTTGAELARPHYLALLAEAYGKMGLAEEGLTLLAEALAAAEITGERWSEAELHRLKGELLVQSGSESEAEVCFHQALDTARHQSAKSLELRAAMSLGRLWQKQGKRDEARRMLADIYGWFTEGFETADLKEAKALLEALS